MSGAASPRLNRPIPEVVWHELECGAYSADLALWLSLAADAGEPGSPAAVLDIGAGTGRVAIALARAGHAVTALDLDPVLLATLAERAVGLPVETVVGDARTFELARRDHALGLVPMQTLQLLRGAEERRSLFEHARAHLRPGSLLALATVDDVDTFDSRRGGFGPAPDQTRIAGDLYLSRAILVAVGPDFIRIERERMIEPGPASHTEPMAPQLDVIELERLDVEQLRDEGRAIGLEPQVTVEIDETFEHTGSEVVIFRV